MSEHKEKIKEFMTTNKVTLTDVIDVVVEDNGFIGVGIIGLGREIDEYLKRKYIDKSI
jgi:hypothetical protein